MKFSLTCQIATAMLLAAAGNCASQDAIKPPGVHRERAHSKTANAFERGKAADFADHILTVGEIRTSELYKAVVLALYEIRSGKEPVLDDTTCVDDNILHTKNLVIESVLGNKVVGLANLKLKYASLDVYVPFPSIMVREQQTTVASIATYPFKGFKAKEVICGNTVMEHDASQDLAASNETMLLDPDDYLSTLEHVVHSRSVDWDLERFRDKALEQAVDEFCTSKPISAQITLVTFEQSSPNSRAVKCQNVSLTITNGKWQVISDGNRSNQ